MRSFSIARQLVQLGHTVTLLAGRSETGLKLKKSVVDGVTIVEMPDVFPRKVRAGGLSPMDLAGRMLWSSTKQWDVIHAFDHRPAAFLPAILGHKLKGGLLVSDWADLWGREGIASVSKGIFRWLLGWVDDYMERSVRKLVDGVTVISSDLDRRLVEMGVPQERRILLPPGAGVDMIEMHDKLTARKRLGLPEQGLIVAFSGYAPYDQEFMSEVVLKLLKKDRRLIVISCGAVLSSLQMHAIAAGTSSRLIQFGTLPLDDIGWVLAAADCLMLPYLNKSINRGRFPNKFGDYLAAGRAIITHPTGDLGTLVNQEKVAVLSTEDPDEFVADIFRLLQSPSETTRLGALAREFAETRWSWRKRAEDVGDFYARLSSVRREFNAGGNPPARHGIAPG